MNFTDMPVWQRSHQLVLKIYELSESFPKKEMFALTNQLRRAVVSVSSNIAEGFGRRAVKDKCHFYVISMGSLREVQNQIIIARDLNYIKPEDSDLALQLSDEIIRMTYAIIKKLKN